MRSATLALAGSSANFYPLAILVLLGRTIAAVRGSVSYAAFHVLPVVLTISSFRRFHMIGPLKTMSALIKKLRRKRKLSTEFHSRWGDVSITYPTEGSWSQRGQPSGLVANTLNASRPGAGVKRRSDSLDLHSSPQSTLHSITNDDDDGLREDYAMTIPTGHYDARLRHRAKGYKHPCHGLKIIDSRHETRIGTRDSAERSDSEDDSPTSNNRGRNATESTRKESVGTSSQRASKSPPLSVTSRMRRHSQQSNSTEPTLSMPNTASSLNTNFARSSVSAPSTTDESRMVYTNNKIYEDKKLPLRRYHEQNTVVRQELVPSYDELYG
ncbi:hypothetical protein PHISCL_03447 [Aspergillus sclerotialis]|uniref:Uncharacterized protein n=1 Tax=Aspergillus sclerotialis TaxID=2070753 RepID=A0A3A2ZS62_9EURO|nr:hypothetical protein PHISCL_03447 [Aspergillus sclerotialis]